MKEIAIKEIMTTELISVSPDTSYEKIKSIFSKNDFHHIPVVNTDRSVAGIISRMDWLNSLKDLAEQTAGKVYNQKVLTAMVAKDFMTENPLVLDPDDNIGLAADIFLANKFHAVPIVEDNQIQGILTAHDLIEYAYTKAPVS